MRVFIIQHTLYYKQCILTHIIQNKMRYYNQNKLQKEAITLTCKICGINKKGIRLKHVTMEKIYLYSAKKWI